MDVALVSRTPTSGGSRSWAVAGEKVELLAAANRGGAVEVEGKLALLSNSRDGVGKGEESGDVVAAVVS